MSVDPFEPLLRTLGNRVQIDEVSARALCNLPHEVKSFRSSARVMPKGSSSEIILIVVSGVVCDVKLSARGGSQITSIHLPGDLINQDQLVQDYTDRTAIAATNAEILYVSRRELSKLKQSHVNVSNALDACLASEAAIMREWMVNLGRREAITRLAHLLCEIHVRAKVIGLTPLYGDGLPLTQQQLSDCLGLTTVHLNRVLRKLEIDGLIARQGRRMTILKWEDLKSLGEFDNDYLHLFPMEFAKVA